MSFNTPDRSLPTRRYVARFTPALTVLTAATLYAAPAAAQLGGSVFQAGGGFESYSFGTPEAANLESLSLLTLPFSAHAALPANTSLDVRGALARAVLRDADGNEATLSGLTDTEIALNVRLQLADATAIITGIVVAPTGHSRHDEQEARVAGIIASELFPFRVSNWGMGGAAGLQATFGRPVGRGSLGFGVGYVATREFEPLNREDAEFTYRPGNQLQVRLAADQNLSNSAKLSVSLAFQRHDEDQLDGANLYRAGNRIQGIASYAFVVGNRSSGVLYAGGLHSAEGVAIQQLAHDFSSRTLMLAGGGLRLPYGGIVVLPSADARVFRRGSGSGQGYLFGLGTSLELTAGQAVISPTARVRFGNLVVDSENESGVTGIDLGASVRFGFLP